MAFIPLTQQQIDAGFAEVVLNASKEDLAFYAPFVDNPNVAEGRYGRKPIWMVLERDGTYDKTKLVLSLNPDVNIRNKYGQTPAMVALEKRMHGVGILFLRHETLDITAQDNQGNDYMKYAVLSRSAKVVYEASKRGIDVNMPDKEGFLPAYWAVHNKDMDVFKALCECGMNRDLKNPAYQKVVNLAVSYAQDDKNPDWVLAVRDGIFPTETTYELTQDWETFLQRVKRLSTKNQWRLNKLLGFFSVEDKLDRLHTKKENVAQLLSEALIEQCRYGSVEDVSLLLSLGADANMRDRMGRTPLFCAVNYQGGPQDKKKLAEVAQTAYQKVKRLLDSGANPNLPNVINNNGTIIADTMPLEQSLYLDRVGICLLLIKAGAKMTTFNAQYPLAKMAVIYAKPEAVRVLACSGADLMQADSDGVTPIEHAVLNDKPYNVVALRKELISQGHEDLFDKETPQGRRLYDLAEKHSPLGVQALNGTLALLTDVEQPCVLTQFGFEAKLASLSDAEYIRLATLAGLEEVLTKERASEDNTNLKKNDFVRAPRHTVFRQALAAFKRKQHAKKLAERVKIKYGGRG